LPQAFQFGLTSGRPVVLAPVILVAWNGTTQSSTPLELTLDGATPDGENCLVVPSDTVYGLDLIVVARSGAGDAAVWRLSAALKNSYGTAALVGSPAILSHQADFGASGWDVSVSADQPHASVKIDVTGAASTVITWKAYATVTLTS